MSSAASLDFPLGVGLEMSTWDPPPNDSKPYDSHYLAYDMYKYVENYPNKTHAKWGDRTEDRTGQALIDAVNNEGRGFGFISHPFSSFYPWFSNWDDRNEPQGGTKNYTGMELISSSTGNSADDDLGTIFNKWDELLANDLPKTIEINDDGDFSSGKFAVGTANSDGSMGTYQYFGTNMTYIQTEARPPTIGNVYRALKAGKVIATTGPLARLTINGYGIGSKQNASSETTLPVKISWYSNPTFGPMAGLKLIWNGDIRRNYFPSTSGADPYRGTITTEVRHFGSGYFRPILSSANLVYG